MKGLNSHLKRQRLSDWRKRGAGHGLWIMLLFAPPPHPVVPGDSPQVLQLHVHHCLCAGGCAEVGSVWSEALLQGPVSGWAVLGQHGGWGELPDGEAVLTPGEAWSDRRRGANTCLGTNGQGPLTAACGFEQDVVMVPPVECRAIHQVSSAHLLWVLHSAVRVGHTSC